MADSRNYIIRKITPAGVVTTLAGVARVFGTVDGVGSAARFDVIIGIAVDSSDNIYVSGTNFSNIRKITSAGVVTTLAGGMSGSADGTGSGASFSQPAGLAADSSGNIYVADSVNNTIRKVTAAGVVTTLVGTAGVSGSVDGTGSSASFFVPYGLTADSSGNLYVTDSFNNTIRMITPATVVTTFAGKAGVYGSVDGTGSAASFNLPYGVTADSSGNIYVSDSSNHTIRKITSAGVVSTLAGNPGVSGSADDIGSSASFFYPNGVTADSSGNIYVADSSNHTIRKITSAGGVTTLAGTAGVSGSVDGTGSSARFYYPSGIAIDSLGNIYVADAYNTIRKITSGGLVTTLAGTAGVSGSADGTGSAASFNGPNGIAVDSLGNIYVADSYNNTIRKITSGGLVTTLAGTAGVYGSADGTGSAASFSEPNGIAVDSSDNIYVTDTSNNTIRKITPAGVVTTVVGVAPIASVKLGPLPGYLFNPYGITISGGKLFIATSNGVVTCPIP